MNIQKFEMFNVNRKNNFSTKPQNKVQGYNLSFTGKDKFVRESDEFEKASQKLKLRFQKLLAEAEQGKSCADITDQIRDTHRRNEDITQISEEYKIINVALNKSLRANCPEDAKKIADFVEAMDKLGKNRGFNRISGYQEIKSRLKNEFVLGKMMISHTSQKVDIPHALLLFGLPGNGKSLFARALAEQTLSNIEVVDAGRMTEEEAMDKVEEYAEKAKQNYAGSKDKKQRTIILINEAEVLAAPDSTVIKRFKKIAQNCSNTHKCTLFLTTNHPNFFDKAILDEAVTPIKIGIEPADRKTCKEIIQNTLTRAEKMPDDGIDVLVDAFFRNPDRYYSNGDIVQILTATMLEFKNPLIRNYLEVIKRNDVPPSISKEDIKKFQRTKKALET